MKLSIVLLILFTWSSPVFSQDSTVVSDNYGLPQKGICAHRGANETHPENTLAAFAEAIRLGAQMIEFDVQMTKDNQLVIMHDKSVDRTTNRRGLVGNLTLKKIKRLDAGKWKSKKFKRERVPTLKEALDIMPKNIWLNIHLKGDERLGAATAEAVIASGRTHQAVIAVGNEAAKGVRQVSNSLMICNMDRLTSRVDYIDGTINNNFPFIQLKSSMDDENMLNDLKRLKDNGVTVNYFHSEDETKVKELLDAGIDFILTDRLSKMLQAFDTLNSAPSVDHK
ncbi:glycerophosphodiester phosphodiesterase [Arenibacter sp. TNZ]|jgi:glycerophosphoryl diester phosphodiesterase|uniref:glycerophosphodiester phosphodiesterase n=1 Tax=Arenibacter TaxID=178469 RepID=UPI000CD3F968|nr:MULTISPECIES: glycerophosphodiester phosphodiesterase family protein [Arenibacter]MCM4172683.1 glycerophosphodiester phosphodiesterase [Arenibacter sp. TNZ]